MLTYGGTGDDVILDMAAGADERVVLTGYTTSSDGTLSDRTKTGHSGWVMCLDAQGNVLWNFCSRHDVLDRMRHPVIHEDGTVSVILYSVNSASEQIREEWIHLSADGKVLEREYIPGSGGVFFLVGEHGYIQAQTGETRRDFYLIEWGGTERTLLDIECEESFQLEEVSGRYFLADSWDSGHMLFAFDENMRGREWAKWSGVPAQRQYRRILELKDGSLVAIGREDAAVSASRVFTHWDKAGNVLTDIPFESDMPRYICETENRILTLDYDGRLILLDHEGNAVWQELTEMAVPSGMVVTSDGRAVIAADRGGKGEKDVKVCMLQIQ